MSSKLLQRLKDSSGFFAYTDSDGNHHRGKTLWDWLELFIIPLVLAIGAMYFSSMQNAREQENTENYRRIEQEISQDNQRDAALQSYLDDAAIEKLLLETDFDQACNDTYESLTPRARIAQSKTITALRYLDEIRRDIIFQFLRDTGLGCFILRGASMPGIDISGNNLEDFDLRKTDLAEANLSHAKFNRADLSGADLSLAKLGRADLREADLRKANLLGANLLQAILVEANLLQADLSGAGLSLSNLVGADLRDAYVIGADLSEAMLREVDLSGADLTGADLTGASYDYFTIWP